MNNIAIEYAIKKMYGANQISNISPLLVLSPTKARCLPN